jgi:hypothetical protein
MIAERDADRCGRGAARSLPPALIAKLNNGNGGKLFSPRAVVIPREKRKNEVHGARICLKTNRHAQRIGNLSTTRSTKRKESAS